jgi:FkbM family methyltransferase
MNLLKNVFRKIGLLQQQTDSSACDTAQKPSFYNPPPSCQIPELATLYSLFLGERTEGMFVEVGAYNGISFSNSSCLADMGWHGILIEPIPKFAQACRDLYRENERVQVIETAIGATNSSIKITVAQSLTTANEKLLAEYEKIEWAKKSIKDATSMEVSLRRLDDVLEASVPEKPIDVLIVDVEGAEASVFAGFTIERWRPRVLIVELAHTHPDLHAVSAGDADLQRQIEAWGYSVIYKDSINTVFLSSRPAG